MSLKDTLKKAATNAAGIAAATSGLSTCHDGGGIVVDPVPPPLICTNVSLGQTLLPTVRKDGDDVIASIRVSVGEINRWQITRVGDVVGAAIVSTALPATIVDSLVVRLRPVSAATTRIDFKVEGTLTGYQNSTCAIQRTFHVTIAPAGVQIAETNLDSLPLSARHAANIVVLGQTGRTVSLEARTSYGREHQATWEVSGGELDTSDSARVQWTLPNVSGIYQAEVLLDYGADGIAFETLMLEVTGDDKRSA